MKLGIADKDRDFDLKGLVNSLNIADPTKKQQVFDLAQNNAGDYGDSLVYKEMEKAEAANIDIDDFIGDLVNKIQKVDISNITNEVEVTNQNEVHQNINVEGASDRDTQQQAATFGQNIANDVSTPTEPQVNFNSENMDG